MEGNELNFKRVERVYSLFILRSFPGLALEFCFEIGSLLYPYDHF
jgi:hypothetical protein